MNARDVVTTALEVVGSLVVSAGVWLAYRPAGVIVAGLFTVTAGYLLADPPSGDAS